MRDASRAVFSLVAVLTILALGCSCDESPRVKADRASQTDKPVKTYPPAPKWAHFFSPEQYHNFKSCLKPIQLKLRLDPGMVSQYKESEGVLVVTLEADQFFDVGLLDIAKSLEGKMKFNWCIDLERYIKRQVQAASNLKKLQDQKQDFSKIKSRLLVRLYAETALPEKRDNFVYRQSVPHLAEILVVVLPGDIMVGVEPKDLESWEKTSDELFPLAYSNVEAIAVLTKDKDNLLVSPKASASNHTYVAGLAISLLREKNKDAIVSFPTDKKAIIQYLDGKPDQQQVLEFFHATVMAFGKEQGPIVAHVYHFHDGKFSPITKRVGDQIGLSAPDGFLAQ